jgi:hypothetical protein
MRLRFTSPIPRAVPSPLVEAELEPGVTIDADGTVRGFATVYDADGKPAQSVRVEVKAATAVDAFLSAVLIEAVKAGQLGGGTVEKVAPRIPSAAGKPEER